MENARITLTEVENSKGEPVTGLSTLLFDKYETRIIWIGHSRIVFIWYKFILRNRNKDLLRYQYYPYYIVKIVRKVYKQVEKQVIETEPGKYILKESLSQGMYNHMDITTLNTKS